MLFRSVIAKAVLGTAALGVVGGAALAGPGGMSLAAVTKPAGAGGQLTPQGNAQRPAARDRVAGRIIAISGNDVTIERRRGEGKDNVTVALTDSTRIYRYGDKDHRLGRDALKVGERIGVRYQEEKGAKVAKVIVILPELRGGVVTGKDGNNFSVRTRDGKTLTVTFTDKTRFFEGRGRHPQGGNFKDMKVGDHVGIAGWTDGNGQFDALRVHYWGKDSNKPAATTAPAASS